MAEEQTFTRKILGTVPKTDDVEVHVSVLTIHGEDFLDIREFVRSLQQYGRGVTEPIGLAQAIHTFVGEAY